MMMGLSKKKREEEEERGGGKRNIAGNKPENEKHAERGREGVRRDQRL